MILPDARPTRRAWALVGVGAALVVTGRAFGIAELFPLGGAVVLLVVASLALVAYGPVRVEAARRVVPARVHAGQPCRVDLHLRNGGSRRSPVLSARDPFDGGRRWARFRVAPLAPRQGSTAAYRVPTDRRGVFDLGPLLVARTDPLGLAERQLEVAGVAPLTVYPRVDRITPLRHTKGADPRGGTIVQPAFGASGDEFHALRPYVMGDDLRRVHWPSSARGEDLLIRQDDLPWQGRATIVVDLRDAVHTEVTFEAAMSAAASIATACAGVGIEVRLVGTDGVDTGHGAGRAHADAILERLAAWDPDPDRSHVLASTLATVGLSRDSTLAVLTTGRAGPGAVEVAGRARRGARGSVVVTFHERKGGPVPATLAGTTVVRVVGPFGFAAAWEAAFGPVRRQTTSSR